MAVKGFRSSKKLKKEISGIEIAKTEDIEQYVTLNSLPSDRVGLDVIAHGLYQLATAVTPSAGSNLRKIIFPSSHNLKVGDVLRFTTNQTEAPVLGVIDSVTVILACELDFDPTTDTVTSWRYTTPSYDKNGSLSVSGGAVQYNKDGSTVTVTRDTVTPANTNAMPIEINDITGKNVLVTASNELQTSDSGAKALLATIDADTGSIATSTASIDTKSSTIITNTGNTATSVASIDTKSSTIITNTGNIATSVASIDTKTTDGSQKTKIVDSLGNSVDTLSSGGKNNILTAFGATNYYASALNSTTTQLASGATFTGTIETIFNQQAASVLVTTDQTGVLTINQYIDAAGTKLISSWPYTISAGVPFSRAFTVNGNYFNLTFRNTGASTTTTLQIDTAYGTIAATTNLGNGNISINEINGDSITNALPSSSSQSVVTRSAPQKLFRTTFANAVASGPDTSFWSYVQAGSGIGISQTGGNLIITSGTTVNDEMIIRSRDSFSGNMELKWSTILSQRIVNQTFYVELVDIIGDALSYSINSATSVTVTIPNNPFTSANIGQSLILQAINGTAGTIPGRYAISAVAGNSVTFTVASWPATGTGTLSLVGWNYVRASYSGATATNAIIETQRRGYNSNASFTATINTTASPGHIGAISIEDSQVTLLDQLQAAAASLNLTRRADVVQSLPEENTAMYLQIHVLNGSTAPASTTTWTIGMASVASRRLQNVAVNSITPMSQNAALPVIFPATPTVTVGTLPATPAGTNVIGNVGVGVVSSADQASAAGTIGTTNSTAKTITNGASVAFIVNITVATLTSYDFKVQESTDGTTWTDIWQSERKTGVSTIISPALRIRGTQYRYVEIAAGTSFTRTITTSRIPHAGELIRNIVDRTIAPITTNSVTPSLYAEGCSFVSLTVAQGAGGSAVQFAIDGSQDGTNWIQGLKTVTGVVSGYVQANMSASYKYFRARVVAGVASTTINYVVLEAKEMPVDTSANNNGSSSGTTNVTTAVSVAPPIGAVGFILQCEGITQTNPIRFRTSGTATTTSGMLLQPGQDTGYVAGAPTLSIVSQTGTAAYNLEWILK